MGTSLVGSESQGNIVKEIRYNSFREFYLMILIIENGHILNGKMLICIEVKVI
jgi:hypothetical protein